MLLREGRAGEHVRLGVIEDGSELGHLRAGMIGDGPPLGAGGVGPLPGEGDGDEGRDDARPLLPACADTFRMK